MMCIRKVIGAAMLVAPLVLDAAAARAATITPTDLHSVVLGTLHSGPASDQFIAFDGTDIGTLFDAVYFNADMGLYTYTHTVEPSVNNISEFNTGFEVPGFNGVAGWSFRQAQAEGGIGDATDFTLEQELGQIIWRTLTEENGDVFFDANEIITFFFQSSQPPTDGDYNLINGRAATAVGFAPIPTPAAAPAGLLLLALAYLRQRRPAR